MIRKILFCISMGFLIVTEFLFDAVSEMFWWMWDKTSEIGGWCYHKKNILKRRYYIKKKRGLTNEIEKTKTGS